jgi:hypothetical protein
MKLVISRVLFICIMVMPKLLYSQSVDEYTLKAIWLGKFTHFIEWPANHSSNRYFTIGVFHSDPFKGKLESIYSNYLINNKPVKIKYIFSCDSIKYFDLLFIPKDNEKQLAQIIRIAHENSVLLIGDSDGYAEQGVHINFFTINEQVRFEINEFAMRKSELFISYRLLNIAKIVQPISKE